MTASSDYAIVARALDFLGNRFRLQPSLDEVAAHVGLSPYHFQRVFSRWAGVSPKRFLQFLTLEAAKERLRSSESVLAAAYAAGLSGPARLHDLFVTVESVTPGVYKTGGRATALSYGVHSTPFGDCLLAQTPKGLCHLAFLTTSFEAAMEDLRAEWPAAQLLEDPEGTASLAKSVFGWGGTLSQPSPLSVVLKGTSFQIKVWNALLRIPPGALTSYGQLATAIGNPDAARAVGTAVARNSIAFLIPCHRVIRSMGEFGGYRWGSIRKEAILGWEAARTSS